jgi:hypothetical protein
MRAMHEKLGQVNMEKQTKIDAERRAEEARSFKLHQKTNNLYGAAEYRKIEWCQAGLVSSAEYDRLTLDKIVEAMNKGYSIKELTPSMIL